MRFRALIEERASENREVTEVFSYVKQQVVVEFMRFKCALQKKMVLFINLLGKGLTQESKLDRGSI